MSGLLQKDFCILMQRSRVLVILIGVGILMGFSTDGSFVIGYLTMLCAILTVSTISYDEFDNGYPFLFTLPITKKTYVTGKFLFCLVGGLAGWAISVLIYIGCMTAKGAGFAAEQWMEALSFIPVFGLLIAIMLPMQLKFGAEKSRLVIAAVAGGIFAIGYIGKQFLPKHLKMPAFLADISDMAALAILAGISLAALIISYLSSLHIMEKKEY